MQPKRYRIVNGILRFENGVSSFEDYLIVPEGVCAIDFNELEFLKKPLRLTNTRITEIDFKNVITVDNVYLPAKITIKERLYWANKFVFPVSHNCQILESPRMLYLNVYDDRPLVYLSASVVGMLEARDIQRQEMLRCGYAVYDPGNHITLGHPVADKYPGLVADMDVWAMERADILFFDLTKLTPGTCAELGYAIAKKWYKEKRCYYMYKDTLNFFINGLLRNLIRVNSVDEFIRRDKQR